MTSSRLHAVRYKLPPDRYIAEKGYDEVRTLVAFPESETAERLAGDDYQVLCAETFQTGFDQPLSHTMYVDKVLTGLTRCRR